ncbi:MAG TPA: hypothetical protein VGI12_14700 [Vicinamibacterales bacterium]
MVTPGTNGSPCQIDASAGGQKLQCTFDASASTGSIIRYEFRVNRTGGSPDFQSSSATISNPSLTCGTFVNGTVSPPVELTVFSSTSSAVTSKLVTFKKDTGC